jgi:hypothetical protein
MRGAILSTLFKYSVLRETQLPLQHLLRRSHFVQDLITSSTSKPENVIILNHSGTSR